MIVTKFRKEVFEKFIYCLLRSFMKLRTANAAKIN